MGMCGLHRERISLAGKELFNCVDCFFMNPKSITLDELYGREDPNSKEWNDGILSDIMCEAE
jgi:dynein heavy chain